MNKDQVSAIPYALVGFSCLVSGGSLATLVVALVLLSALLGLSESKNPGQELVVIAGLLLLYLLLG